MNKLALFLSVCLCLLVISCKKDTQSERFTLLTTPVWESDSLLANGVDASGPGQMLEKFKGDAKFNEDYTGYFGEYTGKWRFAYEETQIVITSEALPISITAIIEELTSSSFKITTSYKPAPGISVDIRMTFKAK